MNLREAAGGLGKNAKARVISQVEVDREPGHEYRLVVHRRDLPKHNALAGHDACAHTFQEDTRRAHAGMQRFGGTQHVCSQERTVLRGHETCARRNATVHKDTKPCTP